MKTLFDLLDGRKTYLLSILGAIYLFGADQGWWHMSQALLGILGFGSMMTLRSGVRKDGMGALVGPGAKPQAGAGGSAETGAAKGRGYGGAQSSRPTWPSSKSVALGICVLMGLPLGLLVCAPGCVTTPGGTPIVTPQRVESVTRLAAYGSARALMLKTPEVRAELERAQSGFHVLRESETWDLGKLASIATAHGLKDLVSEEGTLALTAGVMFLDAVTGGSVDLGQLDYARAVVVGADDGLTLALGASTAGTSARTESPAAILDRLRREAAATRTR